MTLRLVRRSLASAAALLAPAVSAADAPPGLAEPLTPGTTLVRTLAADDVQAFALQLEAGQYFEAAVEQQGIDLALRLRAPDGELLAAVDIVEGHLGLEPVALVATHSGPYRLEIRVGADRAPRGNYTLSSSPVRTPSARDLEFADAVRVHARGEQERADGGAEARTRALAALEDALSRWRALGEPARAVDALVSLALMRLQVSENDRARTELDAALETSRRIGDRRGEARAENGLGVLWYQARACERGLARFERALELSRALGNRHGEAETLTNVAACEDALGLTPSALAHYAEVLPLWRSLGNRRMEATTLSNLGATHNQAGDRQAGLDALEAALALKHELGDRTNEGATLVNLGMLHYDLGDWSAGAAELERAAVLWRDLGNRRGEAIALGNLGHIRRQTQDPRAALAYFEQAHALNVAIGDRLAEARMNIAACAALRDLGELTAALARCEPGLDALRSGSDTQATALALDNTGLVLHESGQTERALKLYAESLALRRAAGNRKGEVATLFLFAQADRDRGALGDARAKLETAIEIVESARLQLRRVELRGSYLASVRRLYDLYVDVLMRLDARDPGAGFAATAFVAGERGRARSLLDLLRESRAGIREGVDAQLVERERSVNEGLARALDREARVRSAPKGDDLREATAAVDALRLEQEQLAARIRAESPRYAALVQPRLPTLPEVQALLDDHTLLLEYWLGETRGVLWAIDANGVSVHALPGRPRVDEAVRRVYAGWSSHPAVARRDPADAEAEALSALLLGPVAEQLGERRLLIVPDGALHYLPFAALPDPRGDGPLVVRHEIATLASAALFAFLRALPMPGTPDSQTLAVLADPVFDADDPRVAKGARGAGDSIKAATPEGSWARLTRNFPEGQRLPRLAFTRREAQGLLALAPAGQARSALDFEANRATAAGSQLQPYRYVHFATHGFLVDAHPDLSGLVLSLVDRDGQAQPGLMTTADVFDMQLRAELVVLSGCRTALGRELRGEGLVGLARAFMYAGARGVLASLWQVDDAATADLMTSLYRGLLLRGERPAAALRAAQRELLARRRFQHPYYWAAFQLQGDWR